MPTPNRILVKMLDRLFAAITGGPSLNCRPHSSRQRIDLAQLAKLGGERPGAALASLLGPDAETTIAATVPPPTAPRRTSGTTKAARSLDTTPAPESPSDAPPDAPADPAEPPEVRAARQAWTDQQSIISKLRIIAEEARTYEDDTGVSVLNIGFPLLIIPPGAAGPTGGGGGARQATRRILAPVAYVPVTLAVRAGVSPTVSLACRSDEVDRVQPNEALLAWIEQQTGKRLPDPFADDEGTDPWREIAEIVRLVATALKLPVPSLFEPPAAPDQPRNGQPDADAPGVPAEIALEAAPRSDDGPPTASILPCAVLGLFPAANQGLLHDTQAMLEADPPAGPIDAFIRAGVSFDDPAPEPTGPDEAPREKRPRRFEEERLVTAADPCQSRAVALARRCPALVIHGPPGTGKSQTITNIIGDHLARGERVLFVCDKRTALDVVANRLDHLGLGSLCALIHDPQREQRDLYMSIRDQLESLADAKTDARAEKELSRIDDELTRLHGELTEYWRDLMRPPADASAAATNADAASMHELMGQWLAIPPTDAPDLDGTPLAEASVSDLESHELQIGDLLRRAHDAVYPKNPWTTAAGLPLGELLSRPMDAFRAALATCATAAAGADATRDDAIPPFSADLPLAEQAAARAALAQSLSEVLARADAQTRSLWSGRDAAAIQRARTALTDAEPLLRTVRAAPLDAELALAVRAAPPSVTDINSQLGAIEAYLPTARAWYGVLMFGKRKAAAQVLTRYGLPLTADAAERARTFLQQVRAMLALRAMVDGFIGAAPAPGLPDAGELDRAVTSHTLVLDALHRAHHTPALRGLAPLVVAALTTPTPGAPAGDDAALRLLRGLERSGPRAESLSRLEAALRDARLFAPPWLESAAAACRRGGAAAADIAALQARLPTLEDVLRIREGLAGLPKPLAAPLAILIDASIPGDEGLATLRRSVLAAEIRRRLAAAPRLRELDARRLQTVFDRYRQLDAHKRAVVRDTILHRWTSRQRERLLATTGSRLNSAGADLRRRLTTRGKKALRLRQAVALGRSIEGGDPLMDLRPVWMASPETVAQVFPREAVFDVVIFDEASQCRLEEALPVLTRAKRLVIAGDPRQLPPTRFFEAAVAASEGGEIETEQDLFEHHQGEIEDLLGAALSLDVQASYLDVHYRSRNADLIAFSNQQFYASRLQPIPGHPSNIMRYAPITLYRAGGVYDKRTNAAEADAVVRIVRDLLRRAEPPSIGIACFNLSQRDLIAERLDEAAAADPDFATRLAEARQRRGRGAFEGLFVKNLENVQGDERDHIIISTTYGPDPQGRFYRRFGPLALPGGGRRLNVLITRAREEVHLVTSIPREVYRSLPPIPQGQQPGGGWLLFSYLSYAEDLAALYEAVHRAAAPADAAAGEAPAEPGAFDDDEEGEDHEASDEPEAPRDSVSLDVALPDEPIVTVRPTRTPSLFAEALANSLARDHAVSSHVHWGNDGFCIDVALRHPVRPDGVTVGVLCDLTRFALADDPVEWDLFRTDVLAAQGWTLRRIWTPTFFRDPRGICESIIEQSHALVRDETPPDSLRVERP